MPVGHDEQGRRQASRLEIPDEMAPRRRGLGGRELEADQLLLPVVGDAESGEHGHDDHPAGQAHAQMKPLEEDDAYRSSAKGRVCQRAKRSFNRATTRETALFERCRVPSSGFSAWRMRRLLAPAQ